MGFCEPLKKFVGSWEPTEPTLTTPLESIVQVHWCPWCRRLNQVPPKKKSEKLVDYHVRLLSEMLSTGPWNRLPLSIRWLRPDLKGDLDFPRDKQPPIHMPILYGPVKSVKLKNKKKKANPDENEAQFSLYFF